MSARRILTDDMPGRPRVALADVAAGVRLLAGLPRFLRNPIRPDVAREVIRHRLAHREATFLSFVRAAAYERRRNPYRRLLARAGCEYGDLVRLVRFEGVEGALAALFCDGVYLTIDEYKGRVATVRGSETLHIQPADLRNTTAAVHTIIRNSGSRGSGIVAGIGLPHIRDEAVNLSVYYRARGDLSEARPRWEHAVWGVPGTSSLRGYLRHCAIGQIPSHWFSLVDPSAAGLHPRYRWSARLVGWAGQLAGLRLSAPEYVPLEEAAQIARWMRTVLDAGRVPDLHAFVSNVVRLCYAAADAGIDVAGAHVFVGGEPLTEAAVGVMRRAGIVVGSRYASVECGQIAYGCLAPTRAGEYHLLGDNHAIVQVAAATARPGLPPGALLISSLRPTAPFVLLNVALGDEAVVGARACGCPLDAVGWTTHLWGVRSYEKLTAGGMTFAGADVIRALEQVLPARFGGGPTHYQLVEDEGADGRPRLRLFVDPAVGSVQPAAILDAFLSAIGGGSGPERIMELVWRQAGFLTVERRPPLHTGSGKFLHVHRRQRATTGV